MGSSLFRGYARAMAIPIPVPRDVSQAVKLTNSVQTPNTVHARHLTNLTSRSTLHGGRVIRLRIINLITRELLILRLSWRLIAHAELSTFSFLGF